MLAGFFSHRVKGAVTITAINHPLTQIPNVNSISTR